MNGVGGRGEKIWKGVGGRGVGGIWKGGGEIWKGGEGVGEEEGGEGAISNSLMAIPCILPVHERTVQNTPVL